MKIKFGAIVTDGRNKIGGHVASKNKAGNYLKTKSTPTNPNTSFQSTVRQNFGSLAQSWRGLTQAQRDSWINGAPSFPYTDIFGDTKILSGFSLYMQLNSNLNSVGAALLTNCPSPASVDAIKLNAFQNDGGTSFVWDATPGTVPAGYTCVLSATPVLGQGQAYSKSKLRQLTTVAASAVLSTQGFADYVARFGAVSDTDNVYGGMHLVLLSTGQVSPISLQKMSST